MQLLIRCRNVELTNALRQHIERRVAQALNRFDRHIGPVWVLVGDVNGPKGGPDKVCRVTVFIKRFDPVVVTESGQYIFQVVDRVTGRAKLRVSSSLGKIRTFEPTRSIRTKTRS